MLVVRCWRGGGGRGAIALPPAGADDWRHRWSCSGGRNRGRGRHRLQRTDQRDQQRPRSSGRRDAGGFGDRSAPITTATRTGMTDVETRERDRRQYRYSTYVLAIVNRTDRRTFYARTPR